MVLAFYITVQAFQLYREPKEIFLIFMSTLIDFGSILPTQTVVNKTWITIFRNIVFQNIEYLMHLLRELKLHIIKPGTKRYLLEYLVFAFSEVIYLKSSWNSVKTFLENKTRPFRLIFYY